MKLLLVILLCLPLGSGIAQTAVADSLVMDITTAAVDTVAVAAELLPAGSTFAEKIAVSPIRMVVAFVLALFLFLFLWFRSLASRLGDQLTDPNISAATKFDLEDARSTAIASRQTAKFFGLFLLGGYITYIAVQGTSMQGYAMEWLNLAVRWTHVIAGIMWIGASFYFIFLENNLNRTEGLRDELAGNLWAVHGGGFYYVEKFKVAPKEIPKHLHWFKYEAYFTWLSGFALLFVVYYADAQSFMLDPTVADLSPAAAVGIGIGSMILGYVIYDRMCSSRLILR